MQNRIFKSVMAISVLAVAGCVNEPPVNGAMLFSENCAVCHGIKGQGDGQFADDLLKPPSDLTGLSARNGGDFPRDYVISTIDGYSRGDHFSGAMPEFGEMLAGDDVLMETGEGTVTPTPRALLALADYLETIQVEG